jgi:alpha-galactosidase
MHYTPLPNSPAEFLILHGSSSTLVIEQHADEGPLWRYWGPRLADHASPGIALRDSRPLPSFMLDHDQPLTVMPGFGMGWFGQSALLAHRDGRDFSLAFQRSEVHWRKPGRALDLVLKDVTAHIQAKLMIELDEQDVLTIQTTLSNTGNAALDLQWLAAATLPLPAECQSVRSYAGQHMQEFLLQEEPLTRSLWRRENRRGRTSHDCFPGAVVTTPGATEDQGLVYGAHLAWSGNHQQTIEWLHDGQYQWQLGEWLAPGEIRIAPGTSITTPEVIASLSTQGFNGLAANFHGALRSRLPWNGRQMPPRPVHFNTWEALYFDHNLPDLLALADAAAQVGVERFVLDDGWFQGRHHDRAALGDWWADPSKYPDGLAPLAAHVVSRGMQFGLWFEPEMVNPVSELYRAHPGWALQIEGRPMLTGRNQLVLDISQPEVSDYLFEKMDVLLTTLPISYVKWDHNRDLATAGLADGHAGWHAQVGAAYQLMQRIGQKHPALEIESCSGGGGRIDFGVLRYAHRVWTSDCIDALSRVDIQRGFLQFFPPEIMGAHIGIAPSHSTGRSQAMAFRGAVALPGHLGIELDVRHLDNSTHIQLGGWIKLYKQWRDHLHHSRVWLGESGDHVLWQMHGQPGGADWLLLSYRTAPSTHRYQRTAKLTMLDAKSRYRLRVITPDGLPESQLYCGTAPFFEALRTPEGAVLDGDWLRQGGLPLPRGLAETAFIVHLQNVS